MPVGKESVSQSHARTSSAVDGLYALQSFALVGDTLQDTMTTDIVASILHPSGLCQVQRERRLGTGEWNSEGIGGLMKMMAEVCRGR